MLRRPSSSTRLRLEALEDRCNPSVFDPVAVALTAPPSGDAAAVETVERHKGELDIESWSWGESNAGTHGTGGGGGAGKVQFQDMHFVAKMSKA
jgi:hypothetical protein